MRADSAGSFSPPSAGWLVGWSAGRLGHLYIDGCNPMIVVLVAIYLFLFLYIGSRCVAETGSVTFARSFDS